MTTMDKKGRSAQHQVDLADAEFQILKQEMVVQHLIGTGEPTDAARRLLERLRRDVDERKGLAPRESERSND
jgi:hypothetical protein